MDLILRKRIAKAVGVIVAALVLWLLGWLCGCSLHVDRDQIRVEFGYPHANHEHALRVTQPQGPVTSPTP